MTILKKHRNRRPEKWLGCREYSSDHWVIINPLQDTKTVWQKIVVRLFFSLKTLWAVHTAFFVRSVQYHIIIMIILNTILNCFTLHYVERNFCFYILFNLFIKMFKTMFVDMFSIKKFIDRERPKYPVF